MNSLAKILKNAQALWPFYIGVIITSAIGAALALASPFIVREATDTIVSALRGDEIIRTALTTVLGFALLLLLADALNGVVRNVGGYIGDVMISRLRQILSTRYYAKLLSLPQGYYDNQVTGTIIARLDRSIMFITQFLQSFANNFFTMLIQVIAILAITAFYYWPLAILLAILFPIYMWLTALTSRRWLKYEKTKNEHIDVANGRFAEVVGQMKVAKSFVAEVRELDVFSKHYREYVSTTRPQSRWWHTMDTFRSLAMAVVFFGIYAVIFWRTLEGHFSIGDMVMLIQMVTMAKQPVFMMSWMVDSAQRAIGGSREYFQVMEHDVEPTVDQTLIDATRAINEPELDTSQVQPLPLPDDVSEPIFEFDDVTFAYEEDKPVIQSVSFTAHRGEKVALVGESGGGKSTLVNLMLGLYQPSHGTLNVLGHNANDLTTARLRASVGVVFQEAFLFSGSIRENIAYGKPDATEEEILEVAKRANAHEFIQAFPQGYDTIIGERGLRLSGGQKQRVAVARAMLKDAPILVLDEATSALDTKSERAVQAGLEELMKDRTTLIIAHRLSTIANVDTIITLDKGAVDEKGSPAHLSTTGGIYAQLLQLTASTSEADRERLKKFGFSHETESRTEEEVTED
ncbi:ABC transporter ATP-binding protein [Corynebacterium ammoniagenes]|uniref:Fatty acid ABC transporter ATP-binding/permease protein n=2 Tax=Corynebacterium ammoniagenes TaxID=1697 RepID=A0AAV5G752_CORAM|nr:ABC transporter ATP-binding protein [Corynebacterium ammoniagenes]APT82134.1 iron ABC transporter ATP-binding protein [Corynebacterium ammoniagenes DSM 20306]AQS73234.1 iron ABC transporter ATP-binding protein [Corynebacterium ammoniagenes]EFG80312.1 ABC transporter, ATP-binding protein [Corynebacterium ammoniagenes DSM 20306]GJN41955.1 iron ABC transporter ATP-binding protein [Corynebacterium ammoniagenes]